MSKRVLVTGSNGFIGSRLVHSLSAEGVEVSGSPALDLFDFGTIESVLKSQRWDSVVHLAAVSHVDHCEKDPSTAFRTNLNGTALMLEGIRKHCPSAHFLFASSAQVYAPGTDSDNEVWFENRKIAPRNVYATTKWQSEVLINEFAERTGGRATVLRLFNHTHRLQGTDFFLPYVYSIVKDAPPGKTIEIPVGNLDLFRDVGSLGDLLKAMIAAVKTPSPTGCETYNICSGTPKHLATLARELTDKLGVKVDFRFDPSRSRANEPKSICGSHAKFTEWTGWTPNCRTEKDLVVAFFE